MLFVVNLILIPILGTHHVLRTATCIGNFSRLGEKSSHVPFEMVTTEERKKTGYRGKCLFLEDEKLHNISKFWENSNCENIKSLVFILLENYINGKYV